MKKGLSIFLLSLISIYCIAQTGTIRGSVTDFETGEELLGATVIIAGTTNGSITDFNGNFVIRNVEAGVYDLKISYVSYQPKLVTELEVLADEVSLLDIQLTTDTQQLEEIVVTAEVIRNSESALLSIKKKSINLMDGISAQSFKKMGDGNAASAIKRVPGVSVQGGKYVYVRGLGDRYTKSVLNGMDIPGLDPDRNTLQLDIFPTSLIDNMVIMKSFTPELSADFTGGMLNIETKDFPEEKAFNVSGSLGFNPDMNLNNDYLSYAGGGADWLGFDDGTRDLPINGNTVIPSTSAYNPYLTQITKKFNSTLAPVTQRSGVNTSLSTSIGNQINKEKATWGYNAALSYKNTTRYFTDVQDNVYIKPRTLEATELLVDRHQIGDYGTNNVLVSGLLGGALKTDNSKYRIKLMHIQNGEQVAGIYDRQNFILASNRSIRNSLEYSERSITNIFTGGTHVFEGFKGIELDWRMASTFSKIEDKDVRLTPYTLEDGEFQIKPSEGGEATRLWRNLDEQNYTAKFDLKKTYKLAQKEGKIRFGTSGIFKQRAFEIFNYQLNVENPTQLDLNGNADELLDTDNIWTVQKNAGSAIKGNYEITNTYDSELTNVGVYVSNELQMTDKLKSIIGLRVEKHDQYYTGQNERATQVFDRTKVIDDLDLFPSANFVYAVTDASNFRVSYSKTIARPSFKEASIAQIADPKTGRSFIGGLTVVDGINEEAIKVTRINNFDVRWEMFQQKGQTFSVSGFYKKFNNPIELVTFSESATSTFQPRNLGDAQVFGLELEGRKNLGFITPQLSNFAFNTNVSFIRSRLEMDKRAGGEYESRKNNLRTGETLSDFRQMQGQSPFLLNAGLSYTKIESGFDVGLFYNVQGKTLAIVGVANSPDVYDQSFHSLNFKASKFIGKMAKAKLSLNVQNIMNDTRESRYESFGSESQIFTSRNEGRTFTVKYSYSF